MKFSKFYAVVMILSVGLISFSGCRKKKDTIAKVYVKNGLGDNVATATVILKGVSTTSKSSSFADTAITNASGEAIFNLNDLFKLGQAGVAVLDIYIPAAPTTTGVIQVEQETTSEVTVFTP